MDIDQEARLIEAVQEHKQLYDKRVNGYQKRNKDSVWERVAAKVNYEGFNAKDCQSTWKSLRNQYMAHRRKLNKPSGSAKGNRPFFRHEDAMRFLNESFGDDETYSNVKQPGTVDSISDEGQSGGEEDRDKQPSPAPENEPDHRSHVKYGTKNKIDSFDQSLLNILKSEEKDEYAAFGELIAIKLRKIGEISKRQVIVAQEKINAAISEAEMDIY